MQLRHALIVDKDEGFAAFLARCARVVGLDTEMVDNRRQALDVVAAKPVAIAFIAVERPKKTGFSLFSDLRRLAKRVPIVLSTATVPMAEMMLHQKLRLHADAYLDKRELTAVDVLETLDGLLDLRLDGAEVRALARTVSRSGGSSSAVVDRDKAGPPSSKDADGDDEADLENETIGLPDGTDPELAALLRGVGALDEGYAAALHEEEEDARGSLDPEGEGASEAELADLRRELEAARRAATSSPFSADYLALSDKAERGEREARRLRRELKARARAGEKIRQKLIELAGKLLDAERARDRAGERIERLEAGVPALKEKQRQAEDRARQLERQLSDRQVHAAREAQALEQRQAEALENQRAELARESEKLRGEHEAALRRQAENLRLGHAEALLGKDAEWRDKLEQARSEHASALETMRRQQREELERVRQEWHAALEERAKRHHAQTEAAQRTQVEELERRLEESVDALRAEHVKELERQRQENDGARRALEAEHKAERGRAIEARDAEWKAKLEELRAEHRSTVRMQREQHHDEIERLNAMQRQALDEKDRAHTAALRQTVDSLRHQHEIESGERESELEQVKSERGSQRVEIEQRYASEIQVLGQLHDSEMQQLRGQHARETERLQAEREAALDELARKLREDQRQTLEAKEREWEARLDALRHEQARAMELEREELRIAIDTFETAGRVDRPATEDPEPPSPPADEISAPAKAGVRGRLRELVAEFKRFDAEDDAPDDDAA